MASKPSARQTDQFERSAHLAPDGSPARLRLADVEMKRGRTTRALSLYREVLEDEPQNTKAAGRYGRDGVGGTRCGCVATSPYVAARLRSLSGTSRIDEALRRSEYGWEMQLKNTPDNTSLRSDYHATDSACKGWIAKTAATKPLRHGSSVIRTNAKKSSSTLTMCRNRFVRW